MRRGRARATKRAVARFVTNRLLNPIARRLLERGLWPQTQALLETRGRETGLTRRVPVGNGLRGDSFWIVTEHGYAADYVKNIQADPRVRVKVGRRWYEEPRTSCPTTTRESGCAGCGAPSTTPSCWLLGPSS